ncbi:enoyl-CoA hydratase/isomerase family protein [Natronosalvus vescus]|uniref:enoyl-CoA hydratase/isomerase family protein n=1 Tax=Natronosalvus vescus TaxID=2953881 RepID=UPI0020907DCB|nr:enoyl-CoA hydratase/isomerase family protein [Natronosalvus vescus]
MIETETTGRVRTIRFARPEARNALTRAGLETLEAAVKDATEPILVLEGNGSAFCAGADLDLVAGLDRTEAEDFARLGQRVARLLESTRAITVAAIDGPARGGGLELALACDLRVGTPASTFGEPGVTFGLFGAWGGTVRLPRIVGEGNALDLACTGRVIDAEEACRMGLLSKVVDDPVAVATAMAEHPPETLEVLKSRLRDDSERSVQEDREATAFGRLVETYGEDVADRR